MLLNLVLLLQGICGLMPLLLAFAFVAGPSAAAPFALFAAVVVVAFSASASASAASLALVVSVALVFEAVLVAAVALVAAIVPVVAAVAAAAMLCVGQIPMAVEAVSAANQVIGLVVTAAARAMVHVLVFQLLSVHLSVKLPRRQSAYDVRLCAMYP